MFDQVDLPEERTHAKKSGYCIILVEDVILESLIHSTNIYN